MKGNYREDRSSSFENCIEPLLKALHWRGDARILKEAMPYFTRITTAASFCDVMAHLNFANSTLYRIKRFDKRLLPSVLVTEANDVMVILKYESNKVELFDGLTSSTINLSIERFANILESGRLFVFKKKDDEISKDDTRGWFWRSFRQNKSLIYSAIFLSFFLNILMLATPIFVMSVYDKVIGSTSLGTLNKLGFGIMLALAGLYALYRIRAKHLAIIGARCDKVIGDQIVKQLLYLAPSYTETATAGAQISRIKDFDRVREFFSGPFLAVFFELPFLFVALIFIGALGGGMIYIPLAMIFLYCIFAVFLSYKFKTNVQSSSRAFTRLQEFILEAIENFRALKYTSAIKVWSERFRDYSASAGLVGVKMMVFDAVGNAISDIIMIGSGLLVLVFGAILVMKTDLSIGAMLAIMMIIWRVLTPLKTLFNSLPRLYQLASSIRQINRLMSIKSEFDADIKPSVSRVKFLGDVSFQRVSMRYPSAYTPSLVGVSFNVKSGSIVAIVGRNGSGKSTILKLLLGLYYPQAGAVLIDNREIRQYNPLDLRSGIGYLSQYPELFFGTIAANLRLGDPVASDEALQRAAEDAGILTEINSLPQGFDTQLTDQSTQRLASSFRQSLCLARAYLRNASILLLDEPGNTLDNAADLQLIKHLEKLRGNTTVFLVTHRPSHLSRVDSVILLDQGQMVMQGPPDQVLNKVPLELL